jgi:hypothetical protein
MTDFPVVVGLPWGELVGKGLDKNDRAFIPVMDSVINLRGVPLIKS